MRLVLFVLNITKEMVTMSPCFFTVSSSDSSCFDLLEATTFLQSQKDWVKNKVISPLAQMWTGGQVSSLP